MAISSTVNASAPVRTVSEKGSVSTSGGVLGWICNAYEMAVCKLDNLKSDPMNWKIYKYLTNEDPMATTVYTDANAFSDSLGTEVGVNADCNP